MNYKLTAEEQETNITWNEADPECYVDTCSGYVLRRCAEAMKRHPDYVMVIREDQYGKRYIMPKNFIRLNPTKTVKMSERWKAAYFKRLDGIREWLSTRL